MYCLYQIKYTLINTHYHTPYNTQHTAFKYKNYCTSSCNIDSNSLPIMMALEE